MLVYQRVVFFFSTIDEPLKAETVIFSPRLDEAYFHDQHDIQKLNVSKLKKRFLGKRENI